ncbi:prepilin-type N-terminal cleavage/methylation domain-containing protein [Elongatibacter sediminis]|uniref:Prepilin-type N-terminal cleavage/methylation domain-containing protein n=1 Tax=Elongatibacter sediminis TaxID=3119006 RepID=A0AAW9RL98_9GAMM
MKRVSGFTLVEMLLAMTLLSILLALAYGGLHAATRATDRGQQILEESGRLRMAHQFVRKQINQAIPLAFNQTDGETLEAPEPEVFLGSPESIRYVAPMPGYLGFGGPQVQELTFVSGDEGLDLYLTHALVQGFDESRLDDSEPVLLIDRVERAEFQFLARDEEGELTEWTNTWETPGELPVAVALDIQFVEGNYAEWPLLVAAVKVDGSVVDGAGNQNTYRSAIQELIEKRRSQD